MKPEILSEKLTSAEDIALTINSNQRIANCSRNEIKSRRKLDKIKLPITLTRAFVLTSDHIENHYYRKINKLINSVLSGKDISVKVPFKDFSKTILGENESKILFEKRVEPLKVNLNNLKKEFHKFIFCLETKKNISQIQSNFRILTYKTLLLN